MKKKKKNKYVTAFLIALIVLAIAAIVSIIVFHEEDQMAVKPPRPAGKKQAMLPPSAAEEKPRAQSPAKTLMKETKEEKRAEEKKAAEKTVEEKKDIPSPPKVSAKLPEKEKVVVAKLTPPRLPSKQVAIIIDDIGYDMAAVRELLRIDADITFAILPLVAHSREAAEILHKADHETLLHLPMEPLSYPREKPGSGALFTDMNDEELVFQLEKNLASVPYVSGVNNHMGSKFMTDEERLLLVFKQLKKKDLFFIDSRTTNNTKTIIASQKVHLTVASRKVFLDNDRNYSKIYQILMDAAEAPAGDSPLIMIGHPYPETIRAIRDARKVFREKGVSIIPVSKLLQKKPS
ncbi:MAG: divergent polysaccharide deacetylase family protein [Deltaproteobacteria bacterium]